MVTNWAQGLGPSPTYIFPRNPLADEPYRFVTLARTADLLEGGGFELVWGFSCQAVVLGCADSFLFGAEKAVFRPVACDQVRGARGRGQGTETVAKLGGLPPSAACVSQRLDA